MSRPGRVRQSTLSQHRHKTSPEHESLRGCGRGGRAHQCAAEESIYTNKNVRVVGRRGEDGERVTYIRQGSLLAHVVPRRDDLAALAEARLRDFGEVRSSVEDGPEATGRVVPRHRLAITRALDRRRDAAARSAASTGLRRTVVVVLGQDAVAAVRAAVVVGRRRRVARVGLVAAVVVAATVVVFAQALAWFSPSSSSTSAASVIFACDSGKSGLFRQTRDFSYLYGSTAAAKAVLTMPPCEAENAS